MIQYEVTFIVDPVLSGDEIKATAQTYVDLLNSENCEIVHVDEMGLRQLAYAINKRTSGVYFCIEFKSENGLIIPKLELALRRDERIMRFLAVRLDKYGVKYNEDKRNGLIGTVKKRKKKEDNDKRRDDRRRGPKNQGPAKKEAPKAEETPATTAEEAPAPEKKAEATTEKPAE